MNRFTDPKNLFSVRLQIRIDFFSVWYESLFLRIIYYTIGFLRDYLGLDEEEDAVVWLWFWEILRYLLVPNVSAKVIIIWYRLSDDGKSVVIRVVKKMVFPEDAVNDADIKTTTGSFGLKRLRFTYK